MAFAPSATPLRGLFTLSTRAVASRPLSRVLPPTRRLKMSAPQTTEETAAKRASELRGPEGIFSKIIAKEIPADILYEDDRAIAFRDLSPQAPTHFLVIPKTRIALLEDATEADESILGHLMLCAARAAKTAELGNGYRIIVNNGMARVLVLEKPIVALCSDIQELVRKLLPQGSLPGAIIRGYEGSERVTISFKEPSSDGIQLQSPDFLSNVYGRVGVPLVRLA